MSIASYTIGSVSIGGRLVGDSSSAVIINPPSGGGGTGAYFDIVIGFGAGALVNAVIFNAGSDTESAFSLVIGGALSDKNGNGENACDKLLDFGPIWRPIPRT